MQKLLFHFYLKAMNPTGIVNSALAPPLYASKYFAFPFYLYIRQLKFKPNV